MTLCQFTSTPGERCLADFIPIPDIYVAGRLDKDSEGLLVLTDNGSLQHRIAHPKRKLGKTYWVQVEGIPTEETLEQLRRGVELNDGCTLPAEAELIDEPTGLWPRDPPIRYRAQIPTQWLALTLYEGRNRQVRRMTAAVGYPTLRLIRYAIGPWTLDNLAPGIYQETSLPPELGTPADYDKHPSDRRHHRAKPGTLSDGQGKRPGTHRLQPARRPSGTRRKPR